jgi:hypothetical protein
MQQPTMTMRPAWSESEDGVTWAIAGTAAKGKIRLMVECMPDGSSAWTTWSAIWFGEFLSGSELTHEAACAAAERAASDITAISHLQPTRFERIPGSLPPCKSAA